MRSRFAMAGLAIVLCAPALAQVPTVKSGVEAWQRGDHAGAVAIWRNLADKGNVDAAFDLGQAYRLGKGVPADSAQAKRWLEFAANKGHVDAQVSLGLLLFDSGDRTAAMNWLKKAAERGEPRALLVVGTALFNGDGLPQDPVLGYAYVSRSAAQGLAPAKSTLAEMDRIMTVEERQKGVAIALAAAKGQSSAKPGAKTASAAPKTTLNPPPTPTDAPPKAAVKAAAKTPPSSASGGWRVQLGAFSTKGAAQALYARLQGKLGSAGAYYIPAGAVTRLQVGPFSKAEAAATCARLKPQPCFPVAAK